MDRYHANCIDCALSRKCVTVKQYQKSAISGLCRLLIYNLPSGQHPHKIPNCLDFFITNTFAPVYLDIESNEEISSDHVPVIAIIFSSLQETSKIVTLTNHKTDWNYFCDLLDDKINLKLP